MSLVWRYAIRSEVGLVRSMNEDAGYAGPRLIAVADGMGGHAAGEVASAATIAALTRLGDDGPSAATEDALRRAVEAANATLRDIVAADSELHGMGTTVTAAMIDGEDFVLAHVGDSRAYQLRDGALRQLTHDHTFVQQLVDDGKIAPEEMSSHPQRSVITRALDGRHGLDVDVARESIRDGDRYLVCSDGLSGVVSDETLRRALAAGSPDDAVDTLVSLALRAGGPDNITCVVADVADDDGGESTAVVAGSADDTGVVMRSTAPPGAAAVGAPAPTSPRRARDTRAPEGHSAGPAAATSAPPELARDDPRRRSRDARRRRAGFLVGALVVLAVAGAFAGWRVVRSQYYVGEVDGRIAILRGVEGAVLGVDMSSVESTTDVDVERLPEFAAEDVREGIPAESLDDARAIVARLLAQAEDTLTASPSPTPGSPAPPAPASPSVAPASTSSPS